MLSDEHGSNPLLRFGQVADFLERCFHVMVEKVQDAVLPVANSVVGGMADLYHRCISTFSSYRDGLFNDAEEYRLHICTLPLHLLRSDDSLLCPLWIQ